MKYFLILIFATLFISCEESETVYDYPDGIRKPDNIIESYGCGNIFVYQFLDSLKALTVSINSKEYSLTKKRQDIDLDISNPNVSVVFEISPNHPDSIYFNFCNDIAYPNKGTTIKYKAISGKLSFSVSEDNPIKEPIWQTLYYVTIRIVDLHLLNQETNDEIIIDEAVFWNVGVGQNPG
ncbi:MAG: hypothetical protein STSR0008_24160 [Ignavibacterium sp.]